MNGYIYSIPLHKNAHRTQNQALWDPCVASELLETWNEETLDLFLDSNDGDSSNTTDPWVSNNNIKIVHLPWRHIWADDNRLPSHSAQTCSLTGCHTRRDRPPHIWSQRTPPLYLSTYQLQNTLQYSLKTEYLTSTVRTAGVMHNSRFNILCHSRSAYHRLAIPSQRHCSYHLLNVAPMHTFKEQRLLK